MNAAVSLHQRPTDVPIKPDIKAEASIQAPQVDTGLVGLAQVAGAGVGAAMKTAGPGGPIANGALGFLVAALIGPVLWMNTRVNQAEETYRAATEKLGAYDARLIKIELTLEDFADSAKEMPEIRKSLERLIEDQRETAGTIKTLERLLKDKEKTL